ncbi:MAG: hypothetical protein GWP50_11970 [Proteobacteria bacterium]|nr:hypothetical protein [Pseudomonadota bacterium]
MSGGKGGSTTSSVTIPEYIEAAAQRNLNKAERISQIGYTPYYGPDVAAFTPMQQAAFQGTAQAAGAFGLPGGSMSQQDIMGGMPAPTTYAGGVQGYSAAPIYEQSLQTLGERRPGQKAYIDSFFIDPYAGGAAAGNFAPIDYTGYATAAEIARNAGDGGTPSSTDYTAPSGTSSGTGFASSELSAALPGGVNDPFLTSSISQAIAEATDTQRPIGAPETSIRPVARPDDLGAINQNQQASVYITDPAAGITDTSTAGTGTQIMNDLTEFGTGLASNTLAGNILLGPSYNVGGANNPIETPTVAEMQASAPPGMTYQPSTGSYVAAPAPAPAPVQNNNNDSGNTAHEDMMKAAALKAATQTATASAPVSTVRPISRGDAAGGADTGDKGGCVVATHAVNSGAFSPSAKREAVVWCMNVLHGKWWGEAIRRGYRHLGRSKIEQGKAHEHYQEFRDYIAFASGKKRTVKGAIHFAARTAQFFAVGLVKKDS